jgi:hypothetical protein
LLTELAELKANGGLASLPKEEGKHKGVMADRFTESVVMTAHNKHRSFSSERLPC